MKLKNAEAVDAYGALAELSQEKLPVRVALRIVRLIRILKELYEDFEEVRKKIVDEHAIVDGSGLPKQAPDGTIQLTKEGLKEWNELIEAEVEVEVEPLELEEIGNVRVAPRMLMALTPFITDEEEKAS